MTTRILCLCLASLFLVACDDGGGGPSPVPGSEMCIATFTGYTRDTLESAVTNPAGACANDSDLDAVCTQDLRTVTGACALQTCTASLGTDAFAPCMASCVKAGTARDPSDACIGCYTANVGCTAQHCLAPCSANPSSVECQTCQLTNGCTTAFFQCSGLPLPIPATGDGGV